MVRKHKRLSVLLVSILTFAALVTAFFNDIIQLYDRLRPKSEMIITPDVTIKKQDKILETKSTRLIGNDKEIRRFLHQARQDEADVTNSYNNFMSAYELLPDSLKSKLQLSSIITKSFEVQNNYLDSFFTSIKY